jgi:mono/diheme cytochrome c family protein
MFLRATLPTLLLLAAAAAPAAAANGPGPGDAVSEARLAYGAYLADAGGCMACHTRRGGRPFEGGATIETPFGTLYTPNITPSAGYGIGGFGDEDFLRALRRGVGPDGRPYYPAFPYAAFAKVGDDELLAVKDYLFSLEPSNYRPPQNELRWPFNIRELMFGWQERYLRRGEFAADVERSEEWNRGAYLVEGLGHCNACHAPRRRGPGADEAAPDIDGWLMPAPDLAPVAAERSVEGLAEHLRNGIAPAAVAPGGGTGDEAMPPTLHDNLSRLALSDLRAMAVYLKDPRPQPAFTGEPLVPDLLDEATFTSGRELYLKHCSACHQGQGQGLEPYFPALQGNAAVTAAEPGGVIETILLGAPADPSKALSDLVLMPSYRSVLSDGQIADIVSFIRAGWGNGAAPIRAEEVRALR